MLYLPSFSMLTRRYFHALKKHRSGGYKGMFYTLVFVILFTFGAFRYHMWHSEGAVTTVDKDKDKEGGTNLKLTTPQTFHDRIDIDNTGSNNATNNITIINKTVIYNNK